MTAPLVTRPASQRDRLFRHVSFTSEGAGCWEWTGTRTKDGYGIASVGGHKGMAAHRAMYIEMVGPIPESMEIDHICRNRGCVNPAHLEVVTRTENIRRALPWNPQRLKSQCAHGHPFDTENTRFAKNGQRVCRTCSREWTREWMRAWRARRKAAAVRPTSRPTRDAGPTT